MLQVDPKKRITIKDLLSDPWMMDGYDCPVKWQSKYHSTELDLSVVEEMAVFSLRSHLHIADKIRKWEYDYTTATYFVLMERKQRKSSPRSSSSSFANSPLMSYALDKAISTPKRTQLFSNDPNNSSNRGTENGGSGGGLLDSPRGLHNSLEGGLDDIDLLKMGSSDPAMSNILTSKNHPQQQVNKANNSSNIPSGTPTTGSQPQDNFDRSVKNRASERYPVPHKKAAAASKGSSAMSGSDATQEDKENTKPTAVKASTVATGTPVRPGKAIAASSTNSPLSPSRSMDSGLNSTPVGRHHQQQQQQHQHKKQLHHQQGDDWVFATPERPLGKGSGQLGNRRVLGSIERGLDKMKNILTPRKSRLNSLGGGSTGSVGNDSGPAVVTGKALCNVSTTSQNNPDNVLNELSRALVSKGIPCQQKGYVLRGKIRDASGFAKLSFELEVCRIPHLNVVGIRRKRLKGDAWCYKKVCEEVLRLAACK